MQRHLVVEFPLERLIKIRTDDRFYNIFIYLRPRGISVTDQSIRRCHKAVGI